MEEAWKNWLFELVAKEVALSGLGGVDLGKLAKAGNLS